MVALGSVLADVLPHLETTEPADHPRAEQEADQKGRQYGVYAPKGDITEHIEGRDGRVQRIEKVVEHVGLVIGLISYLVFVHKWQPRWIATV